MAFPIEIDATALTSSRFLIPGVTGWPETKFVQPLQLDPGKYEFQTSAASEASWGFEVTTDGLIQYDVAYDVKNPDVPGFLAGRGTSRITFVGYDITLDAGLLKDATLYFRLVDVSGWLRTIESPHTARLLPGTYQLALQIGEIAGALFEVTLDQWGQTRLIGDPS